MSFAVTPDQDEPREGAEPILRICNLGVEYRGAISAVTDVSLSIPARSIVALLGSNGTGKTTTLRAILGVLPLYHGRITAGAVHLNGKRLHGGKRQRRAAVTEMALVPEGHRLFPDLTVRDNLRLGAPNDERDLAGSLERVTDLFPQVAHLMERRAGYLSGGEQQMVAVGRALMARPRILLVDEMSLGLAPMLARMLTESLRDVVQEWGSSVLLVEQNARLALNVADRAYVLNAGVSTDLGDPRGDAAQRLIRDLYLGAV